MRCHQLLGGVKSSAERFPTTDEDLKIKTNTPQEWFRHSPSAIHPSHAENETLSVKSNIFGEKERIYKYRESRTAAYLMAERYDIPAACYLGGGGGGQKGVSQQMPVLRGWELC